MPDYQPDIPQADVEFLKLKQADDALLLGIVTVHDDQRATVNLKGPIVINRHTHVGQTGDHCQCRRVFGDPSPARGADRRLSRVMLILSRKLGESIVIDGRIHVTVMRVDGEVVKLGIAAPSEVPVHRKEVYEEIQRSNQQALTKQSTPLPKLAGPVAEAESRHSALRREGVERCGTRRRAAGCKPMSSDIRQPLTTVGETTGSFPGRAARPAREFKK